MLPKDFARTVVGKDYLKIKSHGREAPPVNCFLDFINILKGLKAKEEYPGNWIDNEIAAIKIILTIETRHLARG
ncbi:MAG: hypothetical protein ABI151_07155 [Chitinophagaceae bacterium]